MTVYEYGDPSAAAVIVQPVDERDLAGIETELAELRRLTAQDICLLAVKIENWNHDLSPWTAPAVFGREDFGDGAEETLEAILKLCDNQTKTYVIGGYSLAGLFALWAAYRTDRFAAVAAASPSVWFPGFLDFMQTNELKAGSVFLSLGDREERTKNPVMATVGDCIRKAHALLRDKEIRCTLEWNEGNHFKDPEKRTARALAWALDGLRKEGAVCSEA